MRILVITIALLLMAMPVMAHTDESPSVKIKVFGEDGVETSKVGETASILIEAEDEGFDAGISSIELHEDGRLITRKECFFVLHCEMLTNVRHAEKDSHSYRAVVIDAGGKRHSVTKTVSFLGQNQPPEIIFIEEIETEEGKSVDVEITVRDRNNDVASLTASGLPAGAVFSGNRFTWTTGMHDHGNYHVIFRASDAFGHVTRKTMTIKVLDRNQPFSIVSLSPDTRVSMYEDEERKFTINVADPDAKRPKITWSIDGRNVGTGSSYNFKPNHNSAGTHVITAAVTDGTFSASRQWVVEVNDFNRPPEIIGTLRDRNIEEGDNLRIIVGASDKDNDKLAFSVLSLPKDAEFDAERRTLRWLTEKGDAGIYRVTFRVHDEKGLMDSQTISIRVEESEKDRHEQYHESIRLAEERARLAKGDVTLSRQPVVSAAAQIPPYLTLFAGYGFSIPYTQLPCNAGELCSAFYRLG